MLTTFLMNDETWLVCGGTGFSDETMFEEAMSKLMLRFGCPASIVHGDAPGADTMAGDLGERLAIEVLAVPAEWGVYGRAAGPIRNRAMLAHKPNKVIAFPGGRGTANMVKQARKAGIDVIEITPNLT